jgi:hypothetical protein
MITPGPHGGGYARISTAIDRLVLPQIDGN